MATKKKRPPRKRPPRQVWLVLSGGAGVGIGFMKNPIICDTQSNALMEAMGLESDGVDGAYVAGPYVLAERVRQK